MSIEALLLSSSTVPGSTPFAHAADGIRRLFAGCERVYFAPFALLDHDWYSERVSTAFAAFGVRIESLHRLGQDARRAIERAEGLFVGGGNSFRLLKALEMQDLLEPVRQRVRTGELRYMGASAGSNMACPSLRTTNDMPIVQPRSFEALGLVPFQINPHYVDPDPAAQHMGETREQRIREFLEENDVVVIGLREGAWLRRSGENLTLEGVAGARLFQRSRQPQEVEPGTDLAWMLALEPRFDTH
jgi:dipeptidase E